jgi:hypothetical protein
VIVPRVADWRTSSVPQTQRDLLACIARQALRSWLAAGPQGAGEGLKKGRAAAHASVALAGSVLCALHTPLPHGLSPGGCNGYAIAD